MFRVATGSNQRICVVGAGAIGVAAGAAADLVSADFFVSPSVLAAAVLSMALCAFFLARCAFFLA